MRLINADALMETLGITDIDCEKCDWADGRSRCIRGSDFEDACMAIEDAPTIEERKTGKWIKQPYMNGTWSITCSNCMRLGMIGSGKGFDYCPHCGAKMS